MIDTGKTVRNYDVDVYRDGRWWLISLRGTRHWTQAQTYVEIEPMARELVALVREVNLDEVQLTLHLHPLGS